MNINVDYSNFLLESGLQRNEESKVWLRDSNAVFDYTDGDEVENRIAAIIATSGDVSLFSQDLSNHQTDWPSVYHLSPVRANLMRPLAPILRNRRILEIGAGCGAISRYMGEAGGQLLALEGSRRRAGIAASRCRDLANVTVVNASLDEFPEGQRFDVVTLIGVLEYARKYSSDNDGIASTLRKARSLLNDGGVLIIAIENQLGLKYFAGMHEDHLGRAMEGIQDHYTAKSVVTFGKKELSGKLSAAGFISSEFALPFPDYKLPGNVILPAGWSDEQDFDAATLAGQATRSDRQLTHPLLFSTSQAFSVTQRNGLLADLSNSFLILARATDTSPTFSQICPNVLAHHYAAGRSPQYTTATTIHREAGSIKVDRRPLLEACASKPSALLSHKLKAEQYVLGRHWADELDLILSRHGWGIDDIASWLRSWLSALQEHSSAFRADDNLALHQELPGSLIDAVPRNLIRSTDGHWVFFDQEWTLHHPITLGYLIFRAFNVSLASVTCVAEPINAETLHVPTLFRACLRQLGMVVTASNILEYLDFDAAFESEVRGSLARPLTLEQYEAYTLVPAPDITPLLHGAKARFPGEILSTLSVQQSELEAARQSIDSLNSRLANAGMHVGELEAKVGEESIHKDAVVQSLARSEVALSEELKKRAELEAELSSMRLEIEEHAIKSIQAREDSLAKAQLAALEDQLERTKRELENRSSELSSSNTRLIEQTARLADISSLLSSAAATTATLHLQLSEEKERSSRGATDSSNLRNDLIAANQQILEKKGEIHRLWQLIDMHTQDGAAAEDLMSQLRQDIHEAQESLQIQDALRAELASIKMSTSWRFTKPLRATKLLAKSLLRNASAKGAGVARKMYRKFPISMHRKTALKNKLFETFPLILSRTNAYRRWEAYKATHAEESLPYAPIAGIDASAMTENYTALPSLYVADGVTEWRDYIDVKNRIADTLHKNVREKTPEPVDILDYTSSNLEKIAAKIVLPTASEFPDVSIVIPAYNHAERTLECVASIAKFHDPTGPTIEVIIADDASTEASARLLSGIPSIRFVQQEHNLGFLRNCNSAAKHARGKGILFINNDVQVTAGWLTALWTCLNSDSNIGAVGPKIIYPSGWLQDAGTRLRRDGTAEMIGLNSLPETAAYTYDRDVDYCSGACLLMRREDFSMLGGFDDLLAPAYCEDSDLCMQLRQAGKRIVFCASAVVVHHLSVTSNALPSEYKLNCISRNLETFAEKWREQLDDMDKVRTIAFYLPQFHPFPENDMWWGEGFTEWTNVTKARPNYVGHDQPRVPADLGYYDLRLPEVMKKQAELASRYGVGGFCFYYYWFAGHRLLERPIEQMLASGEPDFPFCLCWANENWTRRWDGQEHDVLMAQNHSDEDDLAAIEDLARYFRSPNYIRINGKPLLLVYRVTLFPDFARTSSLWRKYCRENGIGEIYLTQVESFELVSAGIRPEDLGCDAAVEFPPQGMAEPRAPSGEIINQNFAGAVADYRDLAVRYATRDLPAYKRFMGVMPGWDNTARRQNNSYSFEHSSPGAFQAWLETSIQRTRQQYSGDEQIVFINAWNEWAEGAYLEPDKRFGHSFLQAHLNALETEHLVDRKTSFPG